MVWAMARPLRIGYADALRRKAGPWRAIAAKAACTRRGRAATAQESASIRRKVARLERQLTND